MSLVVLLMAIWALRLALHVAGTNLPRGETQPYAKWRTVYGERWWWRSYFQVHLLQGSLVWFWMAPIALVVTAPAAPLGATDWLALAIWVVGFAFQMAADRQLRAFKLDPANRGQVLRSGAWSLTRHPNYFGEFLMWTALAVFGLAHPAGVLGLASAGYVLWFMAFGSATPMLERHMLKSKPGYADYAAQVPRFFPRLFTRVMRRPQG